MISELVIDQTPVQAIIDTGSRMSILPHDVYRSFSESFRKTYSIRNDLPIRLKVVGSLNVHCIGRVELPVYIDNFVFDIVFLVVENQDILLGLNFLEQHNYNITNSTIQLNSLKVKLEPKNIKEIRAEKDTVIPAKSSVAVASFSYDFECYNMPSFEARMNDNVLLPFVKKNDHTHNTVFVSNLGNQDQILHKNSVIGTIRSEQSQTFVVGRPPISVQTQEKSHYMGVLDHNQRQELLNLIDKYSSVLVKDLKVAGAAKVSPHQVELKEDLKDYIQYRRYSPLKVGVFKDEIEKLLEADVIEKINASYASPAHLVKKKDGTWRFVTDYTKLNNITVRENYPIPHVDLVSDYFKDCKFYTVLDLASGFWQIPIRPSDKQKIAFCTPQGIFTWKVMPFGLCNAPATFQRAMDETLRDYIRSFCMVYFDDIIVFSKSWDEHLKHIELVLKRLQENNFQVKLTKCKFAMEEVVYLGHLVSYKGIAPNPETTAAVSDCKTPKSVKDVRSFLGLAGYYRRFINNFATIAEPLNRLLDANNTSFKWTEDCEKSFLKMKELLVTAPILCYPDFNKKFVLYTDASNFGMGAVLSQMDENETFSPHKVLPVVAYWSRTFSKAERNQDTTIRECLAVVRSIENFSHYLSDKHFIVVTDHDALRWLLNKKEDASGKLARWILKLSSYHFNVYHRQGTLHSNADSFSRSPFVEEIATFHAELSAEDINNDISVAQLNDPFCSACIKFLENGILSQDVNLAKTVSSLAPFMIIERDILLFIDKKNNRAMKAKVVIPKSLTKEVFEKYHEDVSAGHLGFVKTMDLISSRFFWIDMAKDIKKRIQECLHCQKNKNHTAKPLGQLQTIEVRRPLELVGIDITGRLPVTQDGNAYFIVWIDYFTKWSNAIPIKDATSETIVQVLTKEFYQIGFPERIVTDNGKNLMSQAMEEFLKSCKIEHSTSTTYHPQTDGAAERVIGTIKMMLTTYIKSKQKDWDLLLPAVMFAYRNAVHSTTGMSPFEAMMARSVRTPNDFRFDRGVTSFVNFDPNQIINDHRKKMLEIHQSVLEYTQKRQEQIKETHDKRRRDHEFKVDEPVLLNFVKTKIGDPTFTPKRDGPYFIKEKHSAVLYTIVNKYDGTTLKVNIDRLIPMDIDLESFDPKKQETAPAPLKYSNAHHKVDKPAERPNKDLMSNLSRKLERIHDKSIKNNQDRQELLAIWGDLRHLVKSHVLFARAKERLLSEIELYSSDSNRMPPHQWLEDKVGIHFASFIRRCQSSEPEQRMPQPLRK